MLTTSSGFDLSTIAIIYYSLLFGCLNPLCSDSGELSTSVYIFFDISTPESFPQSVPLFPFWD